MKNNLIIDFYKHTGKLPNSVELRRFSKQNYLENSVKLLRFADPNLSVALLIAFKLSPNKAVEYLKKKGENIIPTDSWDELDSEAHDKAFTVSKVMSADLLQLILDHIVKAKEEGQTLNQFQNDILPKLENSGWTGANPSRLKVIYDTNMQMAFGKGQYQQMKLTADKYPYWIYTQIQRKNKRHDHSLLDGKKFRYDDPIWARIFPPSGFGCKCTVVPTDDPSGVENGADYFDQINASEDFIFSPLKVWKPETDKYVDGIKSQLQDMLIKK